MELLLSLFLLAATPEPPDCPCEPGEKVAQTEASSQCVGQHLLQTLRNSKVADHADLADRLEVALEGKFYPGLVGAWSVSEERFQALPADYSGGVWTDRIELLGPLVRGNP